MMIYADNVATTKMSRTAIAAMLPYMEESYGNPSSLYAFGQQAREALEEARSRIAACLGCEPRELTFTSGGSEADNQAILSAAHLGGRQGKRHIISTAFEHHAVLHTLDRLKKEDFQITLLDVHEDGIVAAEQVRRALRPDTCLVTVMYANNEIGTIQPVGGIGAVCREAGVLFHTDAVQAAGHLPIDVTAQNICYPSPPTNSTAQRALALCTPGMAWPSPASLRAAPRSGAAGPGQRTSPPPPVWRRRWQTPVNT